MATNKEIIDRLTRLEQLFESFEKKIDELIITIRVAGWGHPPPDWIKEILRQAKAFEQPNYKHEDP